MIVVETDILCVTILVATTAVVGATGSAGGALIVGAIVSGGTVVVDCAGRDTRIDADVVGTDIASGTVAVDGTSEFFATANVVCANIAGRTLSIMIARVRLLTDRVLRVTDESSTAVGVNGAP